MFVLHSNAERDDDDDDNNGDSGGESTNFMYFCVLFTEDYISQLTALNKLLIFTVKSRNRNATKYDDNTNYVHMTNLLLF